MLIYIISNETISVTTYTHTQFNENLGKYDVIGVLGGYPSRAIATVPLFKGQVAPRIIVGGSQLNMRESIDILVSAGIDKTYILKPYASSSTYEEARSIYMLMIEHAFRSGLIVTNEFHSRRTADVYQHFAKQYPSVSVKFSRVLIKHTLKQISNIIAVESALSLRIIGYGMV